jgi:hypothetical protein
VNSLKQQYVKNIADQLSVSVEDLTDTEQKIIDIAFDIFEGRMSDIKALEDEVKRLGLQIANLKASMDDNNYENDEEA